MNPSVLALLTSRKVVVTLIALTMSFVLVLLGKVSGDGFTTIAATSIGAFSAANAVEHFSKRGVKADG